VQASPRPGTLALYSGSRLLGQFEAPSLKPTSHELDVWLEPGGYVSVSAVSLWPFRVSEFKGRAANYIGPGVAVDRMHVEGPLVDEWPPPSHRRLLGNTALSKLEDLPKVKVRPKRVMPKAPPGGPVNDVGRLIPGTVIATAPLAEARNLLMAFLPRAFRRAVPIHEVELFVAIVEKRLAENACFEDAMRSAYKAALTSPEFLYLHEPVGALDGTSLANRLAYFLWNAPPDESLRNVSNQFTQPAVLATQTERLLNDPRAERFRQDFLDQWLDQRDFDATTPDKHLYPEWGPHLREVVRQEPLHFFKELLAGNYPARAVVQSDFAMLNRRLAEHYGLTNVADANFHKVVLPADAHRGGFLTMAATMKVTANGTTTSPVKRGAWVLKKLLGEPPQPPPPDIAAIEPDVRGTSTVRDMLAKHRDNASCAACHAHIDPPGFALESFDVIGGHRAHYRGTAVKDRPDFDRYYISYRNPQGRFHGDFYHVVYRRGVAVDAAGITPQGDRFAGIDDYRKLLVHDDRKLARNFVRQIVIYATGAPIAFSDRAEIEAIVERVGKPYGLRSLILETVNSPLFVNR
jgi:hypothetical protein